VLLLGAGLIAWLAPKLMRGAVAQRLTSALDASTSIGSLSLADGGISLREVHIDAAKPRRSTCRSAGWPWLAAGGEPCAAHPCTG